MAPILTMSNPLMLLSSLFLLLPKSSALISTIGHETPSSCSDQLSQNSLACQLEQTNLRISRLESILGERIVDVNGKPQYLTECEKKIQELAVEVDHLKITLSNSGDDERIKALEEEVRLLWDASRKKNFAVHSLEYKALEADRKLKELTSQVEEMVKIVSEQWIQIKQLDQAVYMAEVRMAKVTKELWRRCPFIKFFMDLYDNCHDFLRRITGSLCSYIWTCVAFLQISSFADILSCQALSSSVTRYNKAYDEKQRINCSSCSRGCGLFCAVVAFPIMTACMLLLSQLH